MHVGKNGQNGKKSCEKWFAGATWDMNDPNVAHLYAYAFVNAMHSMINISYYDECIERLKSLNNSE